MCSSSRLCVGSGRAPPGSSSSDGSNSGSQYALCALGIGLIALGIVMIAWSVVPSEAAGNSSGAGSAEAKGKTSSVAFVLVGAGVAMLLLSICLGVKNKHRQQRWEARSLEVPFQDPASAEQGGQTVANPAPSYDVPSYEEAVGSGQYPVRQSNLRMSTSQLPSYEDLVDAAREAGPEASTGEEPPPNPSSAATQAPPEPQTATQPSRQSGRAARKLLPLKVRRIKSEKLHLKSVPPQAGMAGVEPLTPPPQYEDKVLEL